MPKPHEVSGPRDAAIAVSPPDAMAPSRKVFVHGAGRCGECHEKMYDEWEISAHAKAATSSLYKLTLADAKDPTCDRCHAPLAAAIGRDTTATEGVTCDVCHTLREPVPAASGGGFRLAIDDMVKFGPRCDLKDHYFHRMGCSPEHKVAIICGTCHWWEPAGIPVFTEYADWRDGPMAAKGTQCQDCHMPRERSPLANGSPVRDGVPHHGLLGLAGDLRARALALDVGVRDDAGALAVTVALHNVNAGHAVPAGLPERRLIVKIRLIDQAGAELAIDTRVLGRVLVDASGAEVPFWRAKRVGADTRIAAGATWQETFAFHPPTAGTVEVEVLYRGLSDAVARELGVHDVEEQKLTSARVPFGAPGARSSRTVSVKPPAARPRPHGATP